MHRRHIIQHGTANEYLNYYCRCDECRKAWAIYHRELIRGTCPKCGGVLANRYVSKLCRGCYAEAIEAPHGTEARYKRCRCDLCRAASARARREYRKAHPETRERENRKRMERYYKAKSRP